MMRAELKTQIPANFKNNRGKPLMVVVHATHGYDQRASAAHPIHQTIARGYPHFNILEVESKIKPSYLGLPANLRTSLENMGILLHREFMKEHRDLLETGTFVYLGGRVNKCLLNAFLSILIAKLSSLEKVFAKHSSIHDPKGFINESLAYALNDEEAELNFHFNCEAIYPSHFDFRKISQDPDYLNWSPNLPWYVMTALYSKHRRILSSSGLTIQDYVDGEKLNTPVSEGCISSRKINLYYWSSAHRMEEVLRQAT